MDVRHTKKYHQASQQDSDGIYRENLLVELPVPETNESLEREFVLGPEFFRFSKEGQQVCLSALLEPRTKAIEVQMNPPTENTTSHGRNERKDCILGALEYPEEGLQGMTEYQAIAIRDRLISEIPVEEFLEMGNKDLCYVSSYETELKPGEPLPIK